MVRARLLLYAENPGAAVANGLVATRGPNASSDSHICEICGDYEEGETNGIGKQRTFKDAQALKRHYEDYHDRDHVRICLECADLEAQGCLPERRSKYKTCEDSLTTCLRVFHNKPISQIRKADPNRYAQLKTRIPISTLGDGFNFDNHQVKSGKLDEPFGINNILDREPAESLDPTKITAYLIEWCSTDSNGNFECTWEGSYFFESTGGCAMLARYWHELGVKYTHPNLVETKNADGEFQWSVKWRSNRPVARRGRK